jgi:hypothetical protein
LNIFARTGEIDVADKLAGRDSTGSNPALNAARSGVVFGKREGQGLGFVLPMVEGASQIPRTGLKICLWIEELVDLEVVDLVFVRPFIRGFLADLHQSALAGGSIFLTIKPALAPDNSFDQHWIELVLGRD